MDEDFYNLEYVFVKYKTQYILDYVFVKYKTQKLFNKTVEEDPHTEIFSWQYKTQELFVKAVHEEPYLLFEFVIMDLNTDEMCNEADKKCLALYSLGAMISLLSSPMAMNNAGHWKNRYKESCYV